MPSAETSGLKTWNIPSGIIDLSVGIKQTPGQGIVIRNYALSLGNRVERLLFAGGESVNLEAVYEEMLSKDWKLRLKTRFRAIITKLGL